MFQCSPDDAYGNPLGFNPAQAATTFLYNNEQRDASTGLYNFRGRPYDPLTGRLPGLDPFTGNPRDPQSFHKYLYGHGDSVNNIDPTGLMSLGGMIGGMAVGISTAAINAGAIFAAAPEFFFLMFVLPFLRFIDKLRARRKFLLW